MFDKLSFQILLLLRDKKMARFKDLKYAVKNPRTLAIKLKKLKQLELVEDVGGRYKLSQKGLEVIKMLEGLNKTLYYQSFSVENVERIPHAYFAPVIRRYCEALNDTLGNRLISVMLFGSIARGDWDKDSDMDILVIAEGWDGIPVWNRIGELRKAKEALEDSLEYKEALKAGYWPIIQNYTLSVTEAKRFNSIYLDAVIDGIVLYDKNRFLTQVLQSLRKKLEALGSMRFVLPDRKFYWVLKDLKAGEVITLE
ncbi:MAG: nucleotidyltransferase domain-containing protein [Candidatus Bathyarchaeia archaeon]